MVLCILLFLNHMFGYRISLGEDCRGSSWLLNLKFLSRLDITIKGVFYIVHINVRVIADDIAYF